MSVISLAATALLVRRFDGEPSLAAAQTTAVRAQS